MKRKATKPFRNFLIVRYLGIDFPPSILSARSDRVRIIAALREAPHLVRRCKPHDIS